MSEDDEVPEWLRRAGQNAESLILSSWPIIRAAKARIEQARAAQAGPTHHTASAHLTATATVVAFACVATGAGVAGGPTVTAGGNSGRALTLVAVARVVLVLLIAIDMTAGERRLSPEERQVFDELIANIGLVLAVAAGWWAIRKR